MFASSSARAAGFFEPPPAGASDEPGQQDAGQREDARRGGQGLRQPVRAAGHVRDERAREHDDDGAHDKTAGRCGAAVHDEEALQDQSQRVLDQTTNEKRSPCHTNTVRLNQHRTMHGGP